jgi:FlaA1/EpsC-like NDP-sugar epimerase
MFNLRYSLHVAKASLDALVLTTAYILAFLIVFEGLLPADVHSSLVRTLPLVILLKLICLGALKVPSMTWRYVSLPEVGNLLAALALGSTLLVVASVAGEWTGGSLPSPRSMNVPLGVVLTDFLLSVIGTTGFRVGVRLWRERKDRLSVGLVAKTRIPTLLIGAGSAGALAAKEIADWPDVGLEPVGFLDDDPKKQGRTIHGVRVLGTTEDLERLVEGSGARQVLFTIRKPPPAMLRRVSAACKRCGIAAKALPGICELVNGRLNLSLICDIAVEDVLHREPVQLDIQAIGKVVTARTVLVTGAGGSIGSELCREVCRFNPGTLLLVEQAENSLFNVHRQLRELFPEIKVVPCVADICDEVRMRRLFSQWRPQVVFHAAAHKHVPLMEWNASEAIKNNVMGTRKLADLADASGVGEFVMISTDKAVNPTSIMGVSKRIAEIYIQALSQRSATRFVTVRFGNVLGSAGSVIPIFKEQIARGGPVTVTDPEMKRYFMTIPEACQLVLEAACMGKGGEIFILDMGEPVKIVDLASEMIRLSGRSQEEIEIQFIGMRPGEKLFEELSLKDEIAQKTQHPKIFIGRLQPHAWGWVDQQLAELCEVADGEDNAQILAKLKELVPEYDCREGLWTDRSGGRAPACAGQAVGPPHRNGRDFERQPDPAAVPAIG